MYQGHMERIANMPLQIMARRVLLVSLIAYLLLLADCSGSTSSTPSASPTARVSPTPSTPAIPAGTVLYQADWSHGFGGWQVTSGWKATNGYLQSDGSNNISITAPYRPTVQNYAVEIRLQVVSVVQIGGFFILSADPMPGRDGYDATVDSLLTPGLTSGSLAPKLSLAIDPLSSTDDFQIHDYQAGSDWRTYRVEVRGPVATLLIDGARNSQALSDKTSYLSNGPIRLKCGLVILRVSDFRIIAL
jgi:hypothetical protein